MMQSFLLIGVGGSGGQTLRFLHRELTRRLRESPWSGPMPEAWQFLHVDVPEEPDGYDPGVPRVLDRDPEYLGLATRANEYPIYDRRLSGLPNLRPGLVGWRPDPDRVDIPIFQGAGQRRALGRVVALSELDTIRDAVSAAISRMSTDRAQQQIQDLSRALGASEGAALSPRAMIITSLGGGAGSGVFLDVVEMLIGLGRTYSWLPRSMVLMYTSEIFAGEGNRPGVQPNTLAAFSEFLAAFEHEGQLNHDESLLLQLGGGGAHFDGRRAMPYNLVIGRSNDSGLTYVGSKQVYEAVGKSLASFIFNPAIQSTFNSYHTGNASGPEPEFGLVRDDQLHENPCSSFGYATVGLGFRLFSTYAAQRLARASIERLLRGHERHRRTEDRRPDEVLIEERAEMMAPWFFGEAKLYELDDGEVGHDDVLDAIRDRAEVRSLLEGIADRIKHDFEQDRNRMTPGDWADVLTERIELERRQLSSALATLRIERATAWTEGIETALLNAVATAAVNEGIPVTARLLVKLEDQLRLAAEDLRVQAGGLEQKGTRAIGTIKSLFSALTDKLLTSNNDTFEQAIKNGTAGIAGREEATSRRFAAAFVDDLRINVLPGLRAALDSAHSNLKRAVEFGSTADEVAAWPTGSTVPPRLRPAPNELLLTDIESFPNLFDDRLVDVFGGAPGTAATTAIREVITGRWPSDSGAVRDNQDLIVAHDSWQVIDNEVRPADQSPQAASFTMGLTPKSVLDRADRWVEERQGAFSQMHFGTLADHLDPAHPDAVRRADEFVDAMTRAFPAAQPLVRIDNDTLSRVHPGHRISYQFAMDQIPIGQGHPARERLEALLLRAGVVERTDQLDRYFEPGSRKGEVEVATFFDQTLHPLVFGSLVGPVNDEWSRRKVQARERLRFWEFRRSRPLTSFIPLSPEYQRIVAKGWLTARILGHVREGDPLAVWSEGTWLSFPSPLLGPPPSRTQDLLPAVLESLPLAMLSYSSGNVAEMAAYERLFDLGEDPGLLAAWVRSASVESGAPAPLEAMAGSPAASSDERAGTILSSLEAVRQYYLALAQQPVTERYTLEAPREWELRHLLPAAVTDLVKAVEDAAQVAPPVPPPDLA